VKIQFVDRVLHGYCTAAVDWRGSTFVQLIIIASRIGFSRSFSSTYELQGVGWPGPCPKFPFPESFI
jgi:hypothetical protein